MPRRYKNEKLFSEVIKLLISTGDYLTEDQVKTIINKSASLIANYSGRGIFPSYILIDGCRIWYKKEVLLWAEDKERQKQGAIEMKTKWKQERV